MANFEKKFFEFWPKWSNFAFRHFQTAQKLNFLKKKISQKWQNFAFRHFQTAQKWPKFEFFEKRKKNCKKWPKIAQNGEKWPKNDQFCKKIF